MSSVQAQSCTLACNVQGRAEKARDGMDDVSRDADKRVCDIIGMVMCCFEDGSVRDVEISKVDGSDWSRWRAKVGVVVVDEENGEGLEGGVLKLVECLSSMNVRASHHYSSTVVGWFSDNIPVVLDTFGWADVKMSTTPTEVKPIHNTLAQAYKKVDRQKLTRV